MLINNAGVLLSDTYEETEDGFEMHFGVNYLGHFLLTNLLPDTLKASAPSRIINLSSIMHIFGVINRSDLNNRQSFGKHKAYAQSKLANILFTQELSRRLQGTGVTVNAVHPGDTKTSITQNLDHWYEKLGVLLVHYHFKTPKSGAQTSIRLAVDPELETCSGEYFADCKVRNVFASARKNNNDAEWLWMQSEKMTKLTSPTRDSFFK